MPVSPGDTAWILLSSALVMLMTPGLALFYGGMVRRKNLLSTIMMSFVALGLVGVLWVLYGYSLSFGTDHAGLIGGFNFLGLMGVGQEPSTVYATTVPHLAFMIFQAMFAIITVALFTGAVVERVKFSALLIFCRLPSMSCQSYLPLPIVRAFIHRCGSAYPLLHLSALECLTSLADGMIYYALC